MITITIDVIIIALKENRAVASVCLALRIKYATAISRPIVKFPLLILLTFRLYLQIKYIDLSIDQDVGVYLVLFMQVLELVNLNLNVKKGHTIFWGNLWCCTVPHITSP